MDVLTPEQVELIRAEARVDDADLKRIAQSWGLDVGHVRFIGRRELRPCDLNPWAGVRGAVIGSNSVMKGFKPGAGA